MDTPDDIELTAGGVLFPQSYGDAVAALGRWFSDAGMARGVLTGVARLGGGAYRAVDDVVAEAVKDLLAIDLGTVVLEGWQAHRDVREAAARSRESPGNPEVVVMHPGEATRKDHRQIDILLDTARTSLATLDVTLQVKLALDTGVLTIVDAALVALQALRCRAEITLTLKPVELVKQQVRLVELPARRLRPPVRIHVEALPQASPPPASPSSGAPAGPGRGWRM